MVICLERGADLTRGARACVLQTDFGCGVPSLGSQLRDRKSLKLVIF